MASFNKAILMGNLTRDPELGYTPTQTAVAEFSLAVNRKFKDSQGQEREEVLFIECTSYGRQAETLAKYLKKGSPLFVEGRLKLSQWGAPEARKSKITLVVEQFQFLGGNRTAGLGYPGEPAAEAPSPEPKPPPQERRPRRTDRRPPPAPPGPPSPNAPLLEDLPVDHAPPPLESEDIPF